MNTLLEDRGLTRIRMAGDGNCFFHAIVHLLKKAGIRTSMTALRRAAAEHLRSAEAEYTPFMVEGADYEKAVRSLERSRTWNSQLCDIAIVVVAKLLEARLTIFNVAGGEVTEIDIEGAAVPKRTIHLLRVDDNHFDALSE